MVITENHSGIHIDKLVGMARRENNKKRKNLMVNYFQGKHVPVSGSAALSLFERLAERIEIPEGNGEGILVIGFAETATAVGASAAAFLGEKFGNCTYIHTSRENIPREFCVADFSEEHSHASEQYLFSGSGEKIFSGIKHIIFVEDELTTGKTILNIVKILKEKVSHECRFYAASLVNGMSGENISEYDSRRIGLFWLVKVDNSIEDMNSELDISPLEDMKPIHRKRRIERIDVPGMVNPRLGCNIADYMNSCRRMTDEVYSRIKTRLGNFRTVDVIGTEEFMFPALLLAQKLEQNGFEATSHSTTRSPIVPADSAGYPLNSRCKLHSLYDYDRTTYLYNLYECDAVIIITDAEKPDNPALNELTEFLKTDQVTYCPLQQTIQ